jgi:hypothetical protein
VRTPLWVALLALLLALVPERFGWGEAEGGCCGEACTCAGPELPSCCETAPGPVIVALCGCGEPHGPSSFERAPLRSTPPPAPAALVRATSWVARIEPAELAPRSHASAPEPPPPRLVV